MQQKVALSGKLQTLIPTIELKASDTKITSKLNKWRDYLFFATSDGRQIDKQRHLLYIFIKKD